MKNVMNRRKVKNVIIVVGIIGLIALILFIKMKYGTYGYYDFQHFFDQSKENIIETYGEPIDVGRILRTFKIKKNVEVTDNGKIII